MKEIELQISQFIDNELNDVEQKKLFAILAEDQNARQTLSDFMQLKKDTSEHYNNITTELILPTINQTSAEPNKKYKMMFYLSLAASIVLAMLFGWNQNAKEEISKQYYALQSQFKNLEKQHLFTLQANTKGEMQNKRQSQASVQKTILKKSNSFPLGSKKQISANLMSKQFTKLNNYLDNIPTTQITKDDFLIPQMIGN